MIMEADRPADQQSRLETALAAFGLPLVITFDEPGARHYVSPIARDLGVIEFSTELGGSGTVTPAIMAMADQGLKRLLGTLGVLQGPLIEVPLAHGKPRYLTSDPMAHYCYAREDGLFEPLAGIDDIATSGSPAARIHFPESPGREPATVAFPGNGLIIGMRATARVRRGDCLFHLAA
jgi:uncharacterized protein